MTQCYFPRLTLIEMLPELTTVLMAAKNPPNTVFSTATISNHQSCGKASPVSALERRILQQIVNSRGHMINPHILLFP